MKPEEALKVTTQFVTDMDFINQIFIVISVDRN